MPTRQIILYCGSADHPPPDPVVDWASHSGFRLETYHAVDQVEALARRGRGMMILFDAQTCHPPPHGSVRRLKGDPFTAIVPVVVLAKSPKPDDIISWYRAGADEVLSPTFPGEEQQARLDALHIRTQRNVAVHPSTRLPGTTDIEREIRRRLEAGDRFAVCYADLDHFKEFNDRYSYYDGDRVIFLLSRILHDVVRGLLGSDGFVGHIGGDDFIFIVSLENYATVCADVVSVFDELITLQYSEQDRRAGYFFGKDRRGQLHRVPLMTLSIGVVTNEHRRFSHPAEVSELATEMKSYAKSLPGSVFVADRRRGDHETRSGPGGSDARSP